LDPDSFHALVEAAGRAVQNQETAKA
jgi:hypothetical protein